MRFEAAAAVLAFSFGGTSLAEAQAVLADGGATAAVDFAAAAAAEEEFGRQSAANDPLEGFNRRMYALNNVLDKYALEPVARGYRAITPRLLRVGVRNALDNLDAPLTFVNDVLQGEPSRAGVTAARFGINTTVGLLGVFDVAKEVGLRDHDEDFGQTLGRWGVKGGPYLVLPVFGPSNVRDAGGRVADYFLNPLNYPTFENDDAVRIGVTVVSAVSAREAGLEAIANLRATSNDPYVTIRTYYMLSRESSIRNGRQNDADLPDFADPMAYENGGEADGPAPSPGENPAAPQPAPAPAPQVSEPAAVSGGSLP